MKISILFFLISILWSCHKQEDTVVDADGVVTKLSHLWKTSTSDNGQLVEVVSEAHITYDNNVLVGGNKNQHRSLISLDAETGDVNWEWDDLLSLVSDPTHKDPISLDEDAYYLLNKRLIFFYATSTYCLDLTKGSTVWKQKVNLYRSDDLRGQGDIFFYSGVPRQLTGSAGETVYVGTVSGGDMAKSVVQPVYDSTLILPNTGAYGRAKCVFPFVQNADTLLSLMLIDAPLKAAQFRTALALYNYSKKKWVYERVEMDGPSPFSNVSWGKLYQNKVYHTSGRSISCHDIMTGKLIWSQPFEQGFGSSGFIIADNKLIANCEDTYTYCLDPATGRQLWKEKSSGSATPISYLNGVAYFLGGGDGKLHAIDATTGQHLWRVKSPDESVNSGAWFYGVCVAVPGKDGQKGRVVATTGLNAYGYEAIR